VRTLDWGRALATAGCSHCDPRQAGRGEPAGEQHQKRAANERQKRQKPAGGVSFSASGSRKCF